MKITGNVCPIPPIILLTNETGKEKKKQTKTNKYKKPTLPPPLNSNYLGRENMKMISDIITWYSPHLKVFDIVERAESECMSLKNTFLKLKANYMYVLPFSLTVKVFSYIYV